MAAPPAATTASATPMPPVPAASTSAVPDWQSTLLGRLEQFKRYPASAQYRGEQGVAYLRFSMDRDGNVLSASIAKTSGYDDLDAETLALIRRAQPLPKPPAEIPGNTIELTVPVQFFLQAQG
jgi:protein TonB